MRLKPFLLTRVAANYEEMFTAFYAALDAQSASLLKQLDTPGGASGPEAALPANMTSLAAGKSIAREQIAWAKATFKGNNAWITWWLRWVRLCLEKMYAKELFHKDLAAIERKSPGAISPNDVPDGAARLSNWATSMEHYMATPAPGIAEYRPLYQSLPQVHHDLSTLEKDWQKSRKSTVSPQEKDSILIQFPDGWAWWLLPRNSCTEESRAMGHCGNGGSYDKTQRILSLRQPKGRNDWEPHLTFILEGNGNLGEMKGKNNDKPVPKYHPYIIALLDNPIVKGIAGGGYLPEHNFSVNDLSEEDKDKLYAKKPELMSATDYYKRIGVDETFAEKTIQHFKDLGDTLTWDAESQRFIVEKWASVEDLVGEKGNDDAKYALRVLNGDEYLDYDSYETSDEAKQMLDDLPGKIRTLIADGMATKHEDKKADFLEDEGEDPDEDEIDFDDDETLVKFIQYCGEDGLFESLWRAHENGRRRSTENDMFESLKSAVEETMYEALDPEAGFWDGGWVQALLPQIAAKVMDLGESISEWIEENEEDRAEIRIDQPRYGWDSYDEAEAVSSFIDEESGLDTLIKEAFGEEAFETYKAELKQRHVHEKEWADVDDKVQKAIIVDRDKRDRLWSARRKAREGDWAPLIALARSVVPGAFPSATGEQGPISESMRTPELAGVTASSSRLLRPAR